MIEMREQFRIAATRAAAWPLLRDPALVAACLPGAKLEGGTDGTYKGTFTFRFGATVAVFRGEATLVYDDSAHACRIEARGVDGRGASRATAAFRMDAAADGGETIVTMDGHYKVAGPLEAFAGAGGVHVARVLMADFASQVARAVADSVPPASTPEASGGRILWRSVVSWVRGLLPGKRAARP